MVRTFISNELFAWVLLSLAAVRSISLVARVTAHYDVPTCRRGAVV
jgi:hypothetical protein